jgi:hypothetical protein
MLAQINSKMKEYFQHDLNSRNDRKLVKLAMRHGMAGVGVYWCIVEMLYEESNLIMRSECERIAFELRVQCDLVESVIADFELFECTENSFFSPSISRRIEAQINVSLGAKKAANTRWEKFKNQSVMQTDANAMRTHDNRNANKEKKRKEKKSKIEIEEHPQEVDLKTQFFDSLKNFSNKYSSEMLDSFANYWTESNARGKMRWQLEKTFEITNRLATWSRNESKFAKSNSSGNRPSKMDTRIDQYQQSVQIINNLIDESIINPL